MEWVFFGIDDMNYKDYLKGFIGKIGKLTNAGGTNIIIYGNVYES
jgi:hypothetical protein